MARMERKDDKKNILVTIIGVVTLLAGLGMLVYHKHWEPLVPIVVGAALIDRRTIVDLVRVWRSGKGDVADG